MRKPKYLARPNDYTIFEKEPSGKYYIKEKHKHSDGTMYMGHGYEYEVLISYDFFPVTKKDFPELKKKSDLYYEYLSWSGRSDGHGGCKGGTFEEFLQMKKNKL